MWFKIGLKAQKLLAQGSALGNYGNKLVALLIAIIPRALPWARSFCPFRACGVHLRNLNKAKKIPVRIKPRLGFLF